MELVRELENKIYKSLQQQEVLLIYGPRRVGKTFLLKKVARELKSKYKVKFVTGEDRDVRANLSSESVENLKLFLGDTTLLIIDEAQKIPNIGINLKLIVDQIPGICVIVSGSASFELAGQVGDPLTGRKKTLKLFPISTKEIIDNLGLVYQQALFEDQLIFGGYPQLYRNFSKRQKENYLRELVDSILLRDLLELEDIRNSKKILDLLTLVAFQIGKEVSMQELGNSLDLHKDTVYRYLDLLEKSFVLINIRGFSRNLRKEVTKTSRYYFYDNGIRNALINNFNSFRQRNDVGELWENFLVVERIKRQSYKPLYSNNYFWRTYEGHEIDWVEEREGKLFGYEFKYNKDNVKVPRSWKETYVNSEFALINQKNYLKFVL